MTIEKEGLKIEKKIVVTFDICSSTAIIEDLHKTENIIKWRDFLIWMKNYLKIKSEEMNFFIYKFTGDGWLLLFDFDHPGRDLITFLQDICKQFKMRYKRKVEDFLETPPISSGMTFGIDRGSLIRFTMNNQREYVWSLGGGQIGDFLKDIEYLRTNGLAKGGSLENAIILGENGILNSTGLRFPDEFVRHKVLDSIGDFSLIGFPIYGHIIASKSGHSSNVKFLQKLLATTDSWDIIMEAEEKISRSPALQINL